MALSLSFSSFSSCVRSLLMLVLNKVQKSFMKLHKRAIHGFKNLRGIFLRVGMYNLRSSSTSSSSRKDCSSSEIAKSLEKAALGGSAVSVAGFRRLRFFFLPCDPALLRSSELSPLLDALEPADSPRPEAAVLGTGEGSGGACFSSSFDLGSASL